MEIDIKIHPKINAFMSTAIKHKLMYKFIVSNKHVVRIT